MRLRPQSQRSRRAACSGQVLAESCIGTAIMTFAWILLVFSTYMGTNHIRTAMAARHAAWMKGALNTEVSTAQLDQWFFYDSGLTKVEYGKGLGVGDLFSSTTGDRKTYGDAGNGPFLARVTFGVADTNSLTKFPFVLLKTSVPFVPPPLLDKGLSVKCWCEWVDVSNTWTSWSDALSGIWDAIKNTVSSFF